MEHSKEEVAGAGKVQQAYAFSIKLPSFWPEDAVLWFSRIESVFWQARIVASLTKFDYVMEKLPNEVLVVIRDVVKSVDTEDPYSLVKNRLLGAYKLSPQAQANRLLDYPEVGGGGGSSPP